MAGPIYFAIGDIHGEAEKLDALHAAIVDRIAFEKRRSVIVHLGDYVDRGPDSRGVIERIMALEQRLEGDPDVMVASLLGNHEQMMLDQLESGDSEGARTWLGWGGDATVASYLGGLTDDADEDMAAWRQVMPEEHVAWLASRPDILRDPAHNLAFVHAGISPKRFPDCPQQIRLWTRSEKFFNDADWPDRPELKGLTVIHGHTPTEDFRPDVTFRRINVDTGACFGGPLTAVMLKDDAAPQFLFAG